MDRGRSPQVPLLQKLLPRLRSSDAEGSASLFPSSEVPAVELVRLAEEPQMGGRTCMNTGLEERSTVQGLAASYPQNSRTEAGGGETCADHYGSTGKVRHRMNDLGIQEV